MGIDQQKLREAIISALRDLGTLSFESLRRQCVARCDEKVGRNDLRDAVAELKSIACVTETSRQNRRLFSLDRQPYQYKEDGSV